MKTITKLALAGVVAMAATNAFADTFLPNTGNGELVLYVRDTTTNATYARGLGVRMDDLMSQSAMVADTTYVAGKQISGAALTSLPNDAHLTSFLNTTHSYVWGIMASSQPAVTGAAVGNFRYFTTTQSTLAQLPPVTNSYRTSFNNLDAMQNTVNSAIASGVAGDKASTANNGGQWGTPGTGGEAAPDWFGSALPNAANLGSAQNLFVMGTSGGTAANPLRIYSVNVNATLSSTGTLTFASTAAPTVPLPAAVWLFGSGLLGLFGVGRTRRAA